VNIYCGNLSFELTEDDLRAAFEAFGEVKSVAIIQDKFTGKSRGFGFVEMASREAGEKAIAELDGQELKDRAVRVNEARPRNRD